MKFHYPIPFACALLMGVCVSSRGQNGVNTQTPGGVVTAVNPIPNDPAPSDPHMYDYLVSPATSNLDPNWVIENMAVSLKEILDLTDAQASKIKAILKQESAYVLTVGSKHSNPAEASIRQRVRDQVRALLTSEQRLKYNLLPAKFGGGLVGKSPGEKLDRINQVVHLTPAQSDEVLKVCFEETEMLMENQAPEQAAKAEEIRGAMREKIRALLTPEQQKIWETAPTQKG